MKKTGNTEISLAALERAFEAKYNSFAAYVPQAYPYVAPGREKILEVIAGFAQRDAELTAELAGAIENLEGIPSIVPHSQRVSEVNYLSLDYLAGMLRDEIAKLLTQVEAGLATGDLVPAAKAILTRVATDARAQLAELTPMLDAAPAPVEEA